MNTVQRIIKNFSSLAVAQLISQLLSVIAVAYLARVLRAEGFGKIGFATAIVAYFTLLVNLGLDIFGTREVARNKGDINRYVNNILTLKLVASIFAFILLVIFISFIPKPLEIKKLTLYLGFTLFTSAFLIEWLFQGIEKMEFIAISQIIRQLCYVALIFLIVKSPEQLLQIPFIQVAAGIVAISFLFSIYARNFSSPKLEFDFSFWKSILKQSIPMGFSLIMITIYYNFDHIMLGFMKNMEVVGWYSAAYKIILVVLTLPGLILSPFFPLFSKYYKEDGDKLDTIANKYVMIMFTVGIPMGFGGMILAPQIIELIYGQGFDKSVLPLQILVWNIVLVFINVAYGNPLLAWDAQKKYMKIVTTGAITNVIFNFLLIPKYSLVGASVATVLAEIAVFFGLYFEFQKTVKISILKYSTKPIIASVIMTIFLTSLGKCFNNIFLLLPIGALVYLGLIFFLKVITINDLRLVFAKSSGIVS